jgi:hypothetical protein
MSVTFLKKQTELDLSQFTHVWIGLDPEVNPRVRVQIGDRTIAYPVFVGFRTSGGGVYDQSEGGECLLILRINRRVAALPGDTIMLRNCEWHE